MRIDQLTPGTKVTLGFTYGEEPAQFVGITGTGEARRAMFISHFDTPLDGALSMRWEAYRFEGHWAYGTSAEPLRLLAIEAS